MILGLIPSRLNSRRLEKKALINIDGLPIIVHTFKRAMMSKKIDKIIVCTDSQQIKKTVEDHGGEAIITSSSHLNGTERISEVAKKIKAKLVIDIQGDEPLVNPNELDELVKFHLGNKKFDIVLPSMVFKNNLNNPNIVKIVKSKNNRVLYFSRGQIPFPYNSSQKNILYFKHLSIISFKPKKLLEFKKLKLTSLEKIEGIELLRALENDFLIGTFETKKQSYAVDDLKSLEIVLKLMKKDRFRKLY